MKMKKLGACLIAGGLGGKVNGKPDSNFFNPPKNGTMLRYAESPIRGGGSPWTAAAAGGRAFFQDFRGCKKPPGSGFPTKRPQGPLLRKTVQKTIRHAQKARRFHLLLKGKRGWETFRF